MARPRKKYSFWTALEFLWTREIQTIQPRPSRAKKAIKERKTLDKVSKQYADLSPTMCGPAGVTGGIGATGEMAPTGPTSSDNDFVC